jgi:hypothetical protein
LQQCKFNVQLFAAYQVFLFMLKYYDNNINSGLVQGKRVVYLKYKKMITSKEFIVEPASAHEIQTYDETPTTKVIFSFSKSDKFTVYGKFSSF